MRCFFLLGHCTAGAVPSNRTAQREHSPSLDLIRHPGAGAESKCLLAHRADSGDAVEHGVDHPLAAQAAVVLVGESMCLVAHVLEQSQGKCMATQPQRVFLGGQEDLFFLRIGEDGRLRAV